MKKIHKHSGSAITMVALFLVLSSFSMPGAHSFQVYLDSKLLADTYVYATRDFTIPSVALNAADRNSSIIVKYSECGRTVAGRTITIKDEQDKILKEWHFDGATSGYKDPMTIKVSDVIALKSKATLKLFYSSNDFKAGQHVASLTIGKDVTAAMN